MSAAAFVVIWALLRLFLWACVVIVRITVFILFAPIFGRRRQRVTVVHRSASRPPAERTRRRYGNEGAVIEGVGRLVDRLRYREVEQPPPPPASSGRQAPPELSRNERDLELALTKLGFPRQRAQVLREQVIAELGQGASLDEMVKRGLQLAGPRW